MAAISMTPDRLVKAIKAVHTPEAASVILSSLIESLADYAMQEQVDLESEYGEDEGYSKWQRSDGGYVASFVSALEDLS